MRQITKNKTTIYTLEVIERQGDFSETEPVSKIKVSTGRPFRQLLDTYAPRIYGLNIDSFLQIRINVDVASILSLFSLTNGQEYDDSDNIVLYLQIAPDYTWRFLLEDIIGETAELTEWVEMD